MAIGTPVERKAASFTGQTSTTAVSPDSTIAAGTVAVLIAAANAQKVFSSVSDSAGNAWTVATTFADGTTRGISFATGQIATQITTGGTITITWNSSTSGGAGIWIQEVSGLASSNVFDKEAHATGTTNTVATGNTATLSQADEIVFSCARTGNGSQTTWTKGASYTDPTTKGIGSAPAFVSTLEYKIVSATTAVAGDGSWNNGNPWTAQVATFKAASANPPVNTVAPVASGTAAVGQTLSCTTGTWTGDATINFTYQWQSGGVDIGGATASTHVVALGEAGTTVTCNVTGTNGAGNATATSNGIAIPALITLASAPAGTTTLAAAIVETLTLASGPAGTTTLAADTVRAVAYGASPAGTSTLAAPVVNTPVLAAAPAGTTTLAVDLNNEAGTFATPITVPQVGALVGSVL